MPHSVLFIAHFFPPTGGAGVQRSLKFVKYLPEFGWIPTVLTSARKAPDRWSPDDQSLLDEVPPGISVHRVPFDAEAAGLPAAQRQRRRLDALINLGRTLIRDHRPDVIFVTMSPFADAEVAETLAREFSLPWVADLRDPWALDEFQVYKTFLHRWTDRARMRKALSPASAIVMNTPEAAKRLHETFPSIAKRKIHSITNGFDPIDFPALPETRERNEHFTIVHAGYFHAEAGLRQIRQKWMNRLLGRTINGVQFLPRSHYYLLKAVERWIEADPTIVSRLRIICLGSASKIDEELVVASPARDCFIFTGYLEHKESTRQLQRADLLFLPMHSLRAGARATIVPGKTYEYLAAGRSILAAVPPGDAKDFLIASGRARICEPDNPADILKQLKAEYDRRSKTSHTSLLPAPDLYQFERRNLTSRLAIMLAQCVAGSVA